MDKLGKIFTSAGFEEDEVKLNAPDKPYLNRLWSSILRAPHYARANSSFITKGHPDKVNWDSIDPFKADPAQSTSRYRYTYYFDTPNLALFRKGIELRLRPEKGGDYRQAIKFNAAAPDSSMVLQRLEFPALLHKFEPDLSAIDKKASFRENALEILRETINGQSLAPKVAIRTQRRKMEYHPDGEKAIMIESGLDIGVGINVAGFTWKVCQAELESKKNETGRTSIEILTEEAQLMISRFPHLVVTTASKPAEGFLDLQDRLRDKKARKIINGLPRDRFIFVESLPAPAHS